jgi:hypothetical protein
VRVAKAKAVALERDTPLMRVAHEWGTRRFTSHPSAARKDGAPGLGGGGLDTEILELKLQNDEQERKRIPGGELAVKYGDPSASPQDDTSRVGGFRA